MIEDYEELISFKVEELFLTSVINGFLLKIPFISFLTFSFIPKTIALKNPYSPLNK